MSGPGIGCAPGATAAYDMDFLYRSIKDKKAALAKEGLGALGVGF